MTNEEFFYWLEQGGRRTALVEVDTDTPHYMSTIPFTSLPTDTVPNRSYLPVVSKSFPFSEKLSLSSTPSISVGTIDLHNEDSALDTWLDEVWVNRAIRVYIGDVRWPRNDFRLVFDGIVAKLSESRLGMLSIVLRNKLERLNTPVTDAILGGTTSNKDRILPNMFGENHNVTPLLVDPANHEYMYNNGESERLIEVRDNGVPTTTVTHYPAVGKFRLTSSPVGQITCSAQGSTPYNPTVSGIVKALVTGYGTPTERLTTLDLDLTNLSDFETECPQPVGINISDRANVLQCCQDIASSVGGQIVMSSEGKLRIVRIKLPGTGVPFVIEPKDYEDKSLSISERTEVISGVKLGYCKNWSMQQDLETGIPAEHRELYAQEYLSVTQRDSAVASTYRLYADPKQEDTLLLRAIDAQAEANRRLQLWKTQRTVFKLKGYAHLFRLELAQAVTLIGSRYGLSGGRSGIVLSKETDWIAGRVTIEVLI